MVNAKQSSASRQGRITFNKKLSAIAVTSALAASPVAAEWSSTAEIFLKPGNKRSYAGVDALVPFSQDKTSLTFADLKANLAESDSREINLGIGHRFLDDTGNTAYGFYGAWDRRRSENGNDFDQISLGVEMLTDKYDLRFNYYHPTSDKELIGTGSTNRFESNSVFSNGVYEEAMQGFDLEVGMLLPVSDTIDTRAYLAAYYFDGDDVVSDTTGMRARIEAQLNEAFSVGASIQDDDEFDTAGFLEVRYAIGKSTEKKGIKTLRQRMGEPWTRDIDIVISEAESTERGDAKLAKAFEDKVIHINNDEEAVLDSEAEPGSFENPYPSIAACEADKCDDATDDVADYTLIRLWQGQSQDGSPYDPTASGLELVDGQTLWGEGADLFNGDINEDAYPLIGGEGSGTAVTLADNSGKLGAEGDGPIGNSVFGIETNTQTGITGENTFGSVVISGNRINAYGSPLTGINLFNNVYGSDSATQTVTITDNTILTVDSTGIRITNDVNEGGELTQTVTIADNEITLYNYSSSYPKYSGISLFNETEDDGAINQMVSISGNTINVFNDSEGGEDASAISMANFTNNSAEGDGGLMQMVEINNNVINAGEDESSSGALGIFGYNIANDGELVQTLSITNNTIEASQGITLFNSGDEDGFANQTATISGNAVNQNKYESLGLLGLTAINLSAEGGAALQTLKITDNSLSGLFSGVLLRNSASKYSDADPTAIQQVTLDGNDISSAITTVWASNQGEDGGNAAQSLRLNNNDINSFYNGVWLQNGGEDESGDPSSMLQMAELSGNVIQPLQIEGDGPDSVITGLAATNFGEDGDNSQQDVSMLLDAAVNTMRGAVFANYQDEALGSSAVQNVDIKVFAVTNDADDGEDEGNFAVFNNNQGGYQPMFDLQNVTVNGNSANSPLNSSF